IRDRNVTGVQTCALPISQHRNETHLQPRREGTIDSLTLTDLAGRRWQRTGQNGAAASAVSRAIAASRAVAVSSASAGICAVAGGSPPVADSAVSAPSAAGGVPPSADVSGSASQPEGRDESVSRAAWPAWLCARSGAFDRR